MKHFTMVRPGNTLGYYANVFVTIRHYLLVSQGPTRPGNVVLHPNRRLPPGPNVIKNYVRNSLMFVTTLSVCHCQGFLAWPNASG
jgi:hypothetical protein